MSASEYVFSRDYLDNNRINLQHYLWAELFGYLLHPDIPLTKPDLKIADVATGTGILLTDLSRRLPPTVQLDAFDISFDAMPPRELLPPNITMHKWDVKTDIPKEFEGIYDVVNVRQLVFVLLDHEVEPALRNMFKMLRPGGYLQWADVDVHSMQVKNSNKGSSTTALEKIVKMTQSADPRLVAHWIPELPTLFEKSGFMDIKADKRNAPGYMGYTLHECVLMVHGMLLQNTKSDEIARRLREPFSEALKETYDGAYTDWTRWTVVGRKGGNGFVGFSMVPI
ncbi:S-adenosyl-L-methionine-dependent methyltransferase [Aspergillus sclerotioniger CBS 115572]|uniref:S-adenosyl-L-methionine-dependent methyltransferase n=1 Tax=Aspergillus sclerotioniger CBS 115572 TaxID=1450535 RepID=A0A317XBK8_9EURO|nr:S-adenosyl-L-methionine-dependent methyltransferase [Aspergillus sclerotioniger CBS 115572]PWY95899.1 S-adenosyl-L-methionine-dependent methyltransferase [Aspergillus sclerotioniger CBS 115572]